MEQGDAGQERIGPTGEGIGDAKVREVTGRGREDWFGILDEAGAAEWTHPEIAAWLASDQGVDPWWSQHLTVAYEQARGIRSPGQRQDGRFEASVSRTVPLDAVAALNALADVVAADLEVEPLSRNTSARHPTARFHLDGGEFVLASASPRGDGRSSISLTWGRMPDGSRIADVKASLREWLGRVG